jgi:26S proteasome regulatory subunit T3
MGDVLTENPANQVPPHKRVAHSTIPSIENFVGVSTEGGDDYAALKKLQRQLEYIQLQEEYIKDEQRSVVDHGKQRCARD